MTRLPLLDVTAGEIVLWKPPGLASELPRDPAADSVASRLRAAGFEGVRLVHRLDSPACGLMLVARSPEAAAYYAAEIGARRWHKVYVAELACRLDRARSLIGDHRAYLKTEGRRARVVRAGGKPSLLSVVHAAAAPARRTPPDSTGERSHVLVRLHTGRFHQIRVMLASLGAPLAGDALYGGSGASPMYLEHVLLGARPFGQTTIRVWRSPTDADRPAWSSSLADAVTAEGERISGA